MMTVDTTGGEDWRVGAEPSEAALSLERRRLVADGELGLSFSSVELPLCIGTV